MPRSLANGNYTMVGVVQSASDPNAWYRVLLDRDNPTWPNGRPRLSCDCVGWIRDHRMTGRADIAEAERWRSCKHTDPFMALMAGRGLPGGQPLPHTIRPEHVIERQPLLRPLAGSRWMVQERRAPVIGMREGIAYDENYRFTFLNVLTPNGVESTGVVAFAETHGCVREALIEGLAAWGGWMIAADVARRAGAQVGPPPQHFRVAEADRWGRGRREVPVGQRQQVVVAQPQQAPRFGIHNLLTAANQTDLGDGLVPQQRAEALIRTFLGENQYALLNRQGYLDVPSSRPTDALSYLRGLGGNAAFLPRTGELVYRVRIDRDRRSDRRVRVFVGRDYRLDLCIVRQGHSYDIPVADAFLTIYLGLLTNELHVLSVVQDHNVFETHSDDGGGEPAGPAPERLRAAAA